jgi:hypothetical protein
VPTILARCSEACIGFIKALFFALGVVFAIFALHTCRKRALLRDHGNCNRSGWQMCVKATLLVRQPWLQPLRFLFFAFTKLLKKALTLEGIRTLVCRVFPALFVPPLFRSARKFATRSLDSPLESVFHGFKFFVIQVRKERLEAFPEGIDFIVHRCNEVVVDL